MDTPVSRRAPFRRSIALLALVGLFAAGCGEDAPSQSAPPADDAGPPQPGGTLRYGLEADTSTPWTPQNSVCAISCHMVMRTVFDTLALYDENGEARPYLAESITPNADFTEWSIVPRAGVLFHDNTPLDAAAICDNLSRHLRSILTGKALLNVNGGPDDPGGPGPAVNADGTACVVPMKQPWTHFPVYLTGQIGYIASPTWLAQVDADGSLATRPVGTGPFVFESYETGGTFVANKNANYWRASEGLPYLNRIELRVFSDVQSRVNALLENEVDMIHLSNGEFIAGLRGEAEAGNIALTEVSENGETNYLLLNNRDPVIQDDRVRRALALATDRESLSRDRSASVNPPANGPFSPEQIGYLEDTGYPDFNLEEATALVTAYEAEKGPLTITFDTTDDPYNEETNQLIADLWRQAGIDVNINTVEQGSFIVNALQGRFQVFGWRNHGGVDPDSQRIWWHSETGIIDPETNPLALNFGGITDPDIDAQFDIIRTSDDDAARQAAAEEINRIFGERVYNIWTTWTVWGLASQTTVHGLDDFAFPDGGGTISGAGIAGTHQFVQMWMEQSG